MTLTSSLTVGFINPNDEVTSNSTSTTSISDTSEEAIAVFEEDAKIICGIIDPSQYPDVINTFIGKCDKWVIPDWQGWDWHDPAIEYRKKITDAATSEAQAAYDQCMSDHTTPKEILTTTTTTYTSKDMGNIYNNTQKITTVTISPDPTVTYNITSSINSSTSYTSTSDSSNNLNPSVGLAVTFTTPSLDEIKDNGTEGKPVEEYLPDNSGLPSMLCSTVPWQVANYLGCTFHWNGVYAGLPSNPSSLFPQYGIYIAGSPLPAYFPPVIEAVWSNIAGVNNIIYSDDLADRYFNIMDIPGILLNPIGRLTAVPTGAMTFDGTSKIISTIRVMLAYKRPDQISPHITPNAGVEVDASSVTTSLNNEVKMGHVDIKPAIDLEIANWGLSGFERFEHGTHKLEVTVIAHRYTETFTDKMIPRAQRELIHEDAAWQSWADPHIPFTDTGAFRIRREWEVCNPSDPRGALVTFRSCRYLYQLGFITHFTLTNPTNTLVDFLYQRGPIDLGTKFNGTNFPFHVHLEDALFIKVAVEANSSRECFVITKKHHLGHPNYLGKAFVDANPFETTPVAQQTTAQKRASAMKGTVQNEIRLQNPAIGNTVLIPNHQMNSTTIWEFYSNQGGDPNNYHLNEKWFEFNFVRGVWSMAVSDPAIPENVNMTSPPDPNYIYFSLPIFDGSNGETKVFSDGYINAEVLPVVNTTDSTNRWQEVYSGLYNPLPEVQCTYDNPQGRNPSYSRSCFIDNYSPTSKYKTTLNLSSTLYANGLVPALISNIGAFDPPPPPVIADAYTSSVIEAHTFASSGVGTQGKYPLELESSYLVLDSSPETLNVILPMRLYGPRDYLNTFRVGAGFVNAASVYEFSYIHFS